MGLNVHVTLQSTAHALGGEAIACALKPAVARAARQHGGESGSYFAAYSWRMRLHHRIPACTADSGGGCGRCRLRAVTVRVGRDDRRQFLWWLGDFCRDHTRFERSGRHVLCPYDEGILQCDTTIHTSPLKACLAISSRREWAACGHIAPQHPAHL